MEFSTSPLYALDTCILFMAGNRGKFQEIVIKIKLTKSNQPFGKTGGRTNPQ